MKTIPFLLLPISKLPPDFFPMTCRTCVDYTNVLADLTVGYMGGEGAQWLLVRNRRGAELIDLLNANRRLEGERDMFFLGQRGEFEAMRGEQRLIGGDDGFAMRQRRLDAGPRRPFGAADQLHEQIDLGRGGERDRIGEKFAAFQIGVAFLAGVARRDRRDDDFPPRARGERVRLAGEQSRDRRSNRSNPGDADAQTIGHGDLS